MSVRTTYIGRFGNNIFQYVCARLFAQDNDLRMLTPFAHPTIIHMAPHTWGQVVATPVVGIDNAVTDIFSRRWSPACYHFCGYYQQWQWYQERKPEILQFAQPAPVQVNYEDIVMHVRLGDYSFIIHPQWYLDILRQEQFRNLYIVMECRTGPREERYLSYFAQYNPVVISSEFGADWNFLRQFDRIISSNSTYSWWAAYLSPARKVYIFKRWCDQDQYDLGNIPNGILVDGPLIGQGPRDLAL